MSIRRIFRRLASIMKKDPPPPSVDDGSPPQPRHLSTSSIMKDPPPPVYHPSPPPPIPHHPPLLPPVPHHPPPPPPVPHRPPPPPPVPHRPFIRSEIIQIPDKDKEYFQPVETTRRKPFDVDVSGCYDDTWEKPITYVSLNTMMAARIPDFPERGDFYDSSQLLAQSTLMLQRLITDNNTKQRRSLLKIQEQSRESIQLCLNISRKEMFDFGISELETYRKKIVYHEALLLNGVTCHIKNDCVVDNGISTGGKVVGRGMLCFWNLSEVFILSKNPKGLPFKFEINDDELASGGWCIRQYNADEE